MTSSIACDRVPHVDSNFMFGKPNLQSSQKAQIPRDLLLNRLSARYEQLQPYFLGIKMYSYTFSDGKTSPLANSPTGITRTPASRVSIDITATQKAARTDDGSRQTNRRRTDSCVQIETQIGFAASLARQQ